MEMSTKLVPTMDWKLVENEWWETNELFETTSA